MKKLLLMIALAGCASLAFAHNCPNEMKAIDAKLATGPKLSEADAAKVKQLRADGETAGRVPAERCQSDDREQHDAMHTTRRA